MSAPKRILIEVQTEHGDDFRVKADIEGRELGVIYVSLHTDGDKAAIACGVADVHRLADVLRHTATSIAWILEHGLEATFEEPQS